MKSYESKSPFEFGSYIRTNTEEYLFHNYLLPWTVDLPGKKIIDLAGGTGVESQLLSQIGFDVCLTDLSHSMLKSSEIKNKVQADAEYLPFGTEVFDGIIFKDIWVFLSPSQREKVLSEMKRILKPSGSIFLMSQHECSFRIHYMPAGSKYPQKETCASFNEFVSTYAKLTLANDNIFSTEYISTPEDTKNIAEKLNLKIDKYFEYEFNTEMAKQNRWVRRDGFVSIITKN